MSNLSSVTIPVSNLWKRWVGLSSESSLAQRRAYTVAAVGCPASVLLHGFYIFLFAYWEVWPLVIANVFSVLLWTMILILWRRRWPNLILSLAFLEVIAHSTLVIVFLGWGFGSQYFVFLMVAVLFLIYLWPRWINLTLGFFCALLFALYYYYSLSYPPLASAPPAQLAFMNIININVAFVLIAATTRIGFVFAERAEAANEALLYNILPQPIVRRLISDEETIADAFPEASILFADIAGLTPLAQEVEPTQLVGILNAIFSRFDELVDAYGLEKIKTDGDEYMVASGIPIPNEDHATALALFALAIIESLREFNRAAGTDLQLRVGLSSGPVVGGIIGKSRFHYDLWGDTVNMASRMQSQGEVGAIQISETVWKLLDDRFIVQDRGLIEIKGKGPMQTYFLRGTKQTRVQPNGRGGIKPFRRLS